MQRLQHAHRTQRIRHHDTDELLRRHFADRLIRIVSDARVHEQHVERPGCQTGAQRGDLNWHRDIDSLDFDSPGGPQRQVMQLGVGLAPNRPHHVPAALQELLGHGIA